MPKNEQLKRAVDEIKYKFGLKQAEIASKLGLNSTYLSGVINGKFPFSDNLKENIYEVFSYSFGGENKKNKTEHPNKDSDLIPFYDVETYGGINGNSADVETAVSIPTSYIKAGEWFGKKITQAIRHYGDSMIEYPSGCILALKAITDIDEIVWGRNYVIETHQNRVTKRLQTCEDKDYVTAYSSNTETYPDGKQIHEPFRIKKENIRHIFLVIGMISKEESSSLMNAAG